MRTEVDLNLCQAYGVCAQLAPAVYELDDDGFAHVLAGHDDDSSLEAGIVEAARACPVQAIITSAAH